VKTLYADHHFIAREANGQPTNWKTLVALLADNPHWRLAVSECNLLEIAFDGDKSRALRRADFLDSLRPVWMMERLDIQKHEVGAFLRRNHFQIAANPLSPFHEHLSTVMSYHTRPLVGATAATWVTTADPNEIAEAKRLAVRSLRTLQAATKQQKQQIAARTFREWVYPKIPLRDPSDSLMNKTQKEALAAFCYANVDRFYRECPAMAVEHYLCEVRARDPKRVPEEADAIDLQHGVLALSYCDSFVTADRYAFSTAAHAIKSLPTLSLATLHRNLDEVPIGDTPVTPSASTEPATAG
jgi:hypothetical protein